MVPTGGKRGAIRAYRRNTVITGPMGDVRNVRYGVNKELREGNLAAH
jgi:hypothetical protein